MGSWTKVFLIGLGVLTVAFGTLSWLGRVGTALTVLGGVAYLVHRDRQGFKREFVRGNLLHLLPGHLALFFGLSALVQGYQPYLWWGWFLLMLATVGFDWIANSALPFERQRRWIMGLYALIWVDILFLLQNLVRLGGRLNEGGVRAVSFGLVAFGVAYIGLALYRFTQLQPENE